MTYQFHGNVEGLLAYPGLEVGMSFLLSGMIAEEKDIHASASRTRTKRRTTRQFLTRAHPAIVLEINMQERYVKVAMTRTFDKEKDLGFMTEQERRYWAPLEPALWQSGVNDLFRPHIQLLPAPAGTEEANPPPSWVYLGRIFKFSYNTPLPQEAKGPLYQRVSLASVNAILTGLRQCNANEEIVASRLFLERVL